MKLTKILFCIFILLVLTFSFLVVADNDKDKDKPTSIDKLNIKVDFKEKITNLKDSEIIESWGYVEIKNKKYKDKEAKITFKNICLKNPIVLHNGVWDKSLKVKQTKLCEYEVDVKGWSSYQIIDNTWNGTFNQTTIYTTGLGLETNAILIMDFNDTLPNTQDDGDMEQAGFSKWLLQNNVNATKINDGTGVDGGQFARCQYNGTNSYGIRQIYPSVFAGHTYHVSGWARSNGNVIPSIYYDTKIHWVGNTSTEWQKFDFVHTNSVNTNIFFYGQGTNDGDYIDFDNIRIEDMNTTIDYSYYGNNGTINGSTFTLNGYSGTAYNFDGINDSIYIPSFNLTAYDTYSMWINNGSWYHIVNSSGTIYVNNVVGSSTLPIYTDGTTTFIGKYDSTTFFNGTIDELIIFDRTLSSTEVSELYSETYTLTDYKYYKDGDYLSEIYNSSDYNSDIETNVWTANAFPTLLGISYVFGRAGDCATITSKDWTLGVLSGSEYTFSGETGECFQYQLFINDDDGFQTYENVTISAFKVKMPSVYINATECGTVEDDCMSAFMTLLNDTDDMNVTIEWQVNNITVVTDSSDGFVNGSVALVFTDSEESGYVKDDYVRLCVTPTTTTAYGNVIGETNCSTPDIINNSNFTVTREYPIVANFTRQVGDDITFEISLTDPDSDVTCNWTAANTLAPYTIYSTGLTFTPDTSDFNADEEVVVTVNCTDGEYTNEVSWNMILTAPLATGLGASIAIMIFYSLLIILLGLATWYFDNSLKFFFLLLTSLMVLVGMNITATMAADVGASIASLLWVVYKVGVFVFLFLFFVVLVKLTGELKLRRNAMNTDNLDSPGDDFKRNFR